MGIFLGLLPWKSISPPIPAPRPRNSNRASTAVGIEYHADLASSVERVSGELICFDGPRETNKSLWQPTDIGGVETAPRVAVRPSFFNQKRRTA